MVDRQLFDHPSLPRVRNYRGARALSQRRSAVFPHFCLMVLHHQVGLTAVGHRLVLCNFGLEPQHVSRTVLFRECT